MSKRTKYTATKKYEILMEYEDEIGTTNEISTNAFYNWKYNYSKYGINRLRESKTCKCYIVSTRQVYCWLYTRTF